MPQRDYTKLIAETDEAYRKYSPRSAAIQERACRVMVDGGSHTMRLMPPFPARIKSCKGAWIVDEDNHRILDFWQGHMGNLMGYNPPQITEVLARAFQEGFGLQSGLTDELQVEAAELLCRSTGSERVRFTTSGALATMYAIMLARAYTARPLVLKVGGGWHGAHPWALKGSAFHDGSYDHIDSEGLPASIDGEVLNTTFNDPEMLRQNFKQHGDRIACFIVEPFIGGGGILAADPEYIRAARELTSQYGALLIFDEVVSGFRFRAGDLGRMYGTQPDLSVFGKIIGGGMPVAAVAGKADILNLTSKEKGVRVKFSGGTYSGHPASMLAAKTMMSYLIANESEIYPRLAALGDQARHTVESSFAAEGIYARCTGGGNAVIPGSSLFFAHLPYRQDTVLNKPEVLYDQEQCDVHLAYLLLERLLILEDIHLIHSHGAVSSAHTPQDIEFFGEALRRVARRIKPYL